MGSEWRRRKNRKRGCEMGSGRQGQGRDTKSRNAKENAEKFQGEWALQGPVCLADSRGLAWGNDESCFHLEF